MLISKELLDLNKQVRDEKGEVYQDCNMVMRELDPIRRMRLKRINHLIDEIATTIGESSGWIYSPSGFTLKSDYEYNPDKEEITFKVNRVNKTISCYEPSKDRTAYELLFITKYQDFLSRLSKLENKRATIINPILNSHYTSLTYTKGTDNKEVAEPETKESSYLQIASDQFISHFGEEGIRRLVNLLNYLVNTNDNDPIAMYNRQFFSGATSLYIDELYRWAVAFTPRAEYVEKAVTRKKEAMERELNPEGYSYH